MWYILALHLVWFLFLLMSIRQAFLKCVLHLPVLHFQGLGVNTIYDAKLYCPIYWPDTIYDGALDVSIDVKHNFNITCIIVQYKVHL
jgi:hypothetical protein